MWGYVLSEKRIISIWSSAAPGARLPDPLDVAIATRYFGASVESTAYVSDIGPGTLAFCSKGSLGLITGNEPKKITYKRCENCCNNDGDECACETGLAWTGIHLTDKIAPVGSPWSSRSPRPVARIRDFADNFSIALAITNVGTFWWNPEVE